MASRRRSRIGSNSRPNRKLASLIDEIAEESVVFDDAPARELPEDIREELVEMLNDG